MKVKVLIRSGLKKIISDTEVYFQLDDGSTVKDAAKELGRTYGDEAYKYLFSGRGALQVLCIKNHRRCLPEEALEENDELSFMPPIAGG